MKCILLVRISTEHQSLDAQSEELRRLAEADGYKDIITIAEIESGIKLKEEERKGLNRMKELILNDPQIDCVYVWEISRIARKMNVLMNVKEFLIEHKIQLKVKEPALTLLKEDGTQDASVDLVFNIYATLAEQEMRNKKARFRRSKVRNGELGLYNGGPIKFGYTVNEKNEYVICEEEAKIVRLIYDLYIETDMSVRALEKELYERGLTYRGTKPLYNRFLFCVLKDEAYTGERISETGIKRKYPVIIPRKRFELARKRAEEKTQYKRFTVCRFLLGQKLIKCPKCGKFYVAQMCSSDNCPNLYRCGGRTPLSKLVERCDNGITMTIEYFDELVWKVVKFIEMGVMFVENKEQMEKFEGLIEVKTQKIENFKKETNKITDSLSRASDMYINGYITKEKFEATTEKIKKKKDEFARLISELEAEVQNHKDMLLELEATNVRNMKIDDVETYLDNLTQKEKYDLVHKHISYATIENDITKHPFLEKKKPGGVLGDKYRTKKITLHLKDGTKQIYWFFSNLARFKDITPFVADPNNYKF